jgi:hypothetical protein
MNTDAITRHKFALEFINLLLSLSLSLSLSPPSFASQAGPLDSVNSCKIAVIPSCVRHAVWGSRSVVCRCDKFSRSRWPGGLRRGLRQLACCDCRFESRQGHGCLSVVRIVCCQVEVPVSGWSFIQRSPTTCVCVYTRVFNCVWSGQRACQVHKQPKTAFLMAIRDTQNVAYENYHLFGYYALQFGATSLEVVMSLSSTLISCSTYDSSKHEIYLR